MSTQKRFGFFVAVCGQVVEDHGDDQSQLHHAMGHYRQLRLAYLAPEVLKRLVFRREVSAVTVMQLSDCAGLPWADQAGVVFVQTLAPPNHQKA